MPPLRLSLSLHPALQQQVGTVPIYQALEKVNGIVEDLNWEVFKQVRCDCPVLCCAESLKARQTPTFVPHVQSVDRSIP